MCKWFGEDICQLIICGSVNKLNLSMLNLLQDKMVMPLMCFVWAWNTGFFAIFKTLWLSHKSFVASSWWRPISVRILLSHIASQAAVTIALYSASVDDIATLGYFLLLHETVVELRLKQYLDVEFQLSMHPTQSESTYPCNLKFSVCIYSSPNYKVSRRYLRIRLAAI